MRSTYVWWKDWGTWLLLIPVFVMFVPPPAGTAQIASVSSYLLASAGAFILAWRAGAAEENAAETGFSWRAGALGYGVLFAGDVFFTVGSYGPSPAFQPAAKVLFILVYPLFAFSLLRAIRRVTRYVGIRLAIDLLCVAVTGAMLALYFSHGATDLSPGTLAVAAGFPIGNLAMIVITGLTVFEVHAAASTRPLVLVATGNLLFLVANLGFGHEMMHHGGFDGLMMSEPLFGFASFGGRVLVAGAAWDQYRMGAQGRLTPIPRGLSLWMGNVVPYSGLLITAMFLLGIARREGADLVPLIAGGAALTFLLILRQHVLLRENTDLSSEALNLAQNLQRSESRFRSVVQNSADIVLIAGAGGHILYVSPAVTQVLGYTEAEVTGRRGAEFIHPDDMQAMTDWLRMRFHRPNDETARASFRALRRDGGVRHMEMAVSSVAVDSVQGIVANLRDVTDRVALEEQLKYQAFHDPLTGLANRALLRDRVGQALARSARRGEPLAVFFLDLDGFKLVNDTQGHRAGDRLLTQVARRLVGVLRPGDTVARLGGDEFAVLVEGAGADQAAETAGRILAEMQAPLEVDGKEVIIGVSIGIALCAAPGQSADDLLRNADLAMYRAKTSGKGCFRFFEPSMYSAMVSRMDLEADLRWALSNGELTVHYQPVVDLSTGEMRGTEALMRWRHPRRGMVSPAQFIPVAEETGLIVPMGRWVLQEACRQTRQWQERYPASRQLSVSVNLSVRQLLDPRLVSDVEEVLAATGLPPSSLLLEVTESIFLESTDETTGAMQRLRALGVRLAVDDFGTGYSSLGYLKRFPLDVLKIDQSFIRTLDGDGQDIDLVSGILDLARGLRMQTVAEGVEREQQRQILARLGCALAQGYHFSRPREAAEIGELLGRRGAVLAG